MDDFYKIKEQHASQYEWRGSIVFDPGHSIFKGHFPGQPIVPGACIIDIVQHILEMQTGITLQMVNATQIKFIRPVLPDDQPSFQLSWSVNEDIIEVTATAALNATIVFKMHGNYRPANSIYPASAGI